MDNSSFFYDCYSKAKRLDDHGFSSCPNAEDLVFYIMDLNDRIDAICKFLKVETLKDHRKRWIVHPVSGYHSKSSGVWPW